MIHVHGANSNETLRVLKICRGVPVVSYCIVTSNANELSIVAGSSGRERALFHVKR